MSDVIIVGGGIIGLLSARELLQAGAKVTLIDKSEVGTEASWAGGGIGSPLYPCHYQDPISDLVRWAQAYYPNLSDQLREETGVDPQFNPCGLFMLGLIDSPYFFCAMDIYGQSLTAWYYIPFGKLT